MVQTAEFSAKQSPVQSMLNAKTNPGTKKTYRNRGPHNCSPVLKSALYVGGAPNVRYQHGKPTSMSPTSSMVGKGGSCGSAAGRTAFCCECDPLVSRDSPLAFFEGAPLAAVVPAKKNTSKYYNTFTTFYSKARASRYVYNFVDAAGIPSTALCTRAIQHIRTYLQKMILKHAPCATCTTLSTLQATPV